MRAQARFARSIVKKAAITTLGVAATLALTSAPVSAVTPAPANATETIHVTECNPLGVLWFTDPVGDHCFVGSGDLNVDFRDVIRFKSGAYSGWPDGTTRLTFVPNEVYGATGWPM